MAKILIVDDERGLRLLVSGTLEINNYDVIEADNGEDAIAMTMERRPDLIILDVMMPGISGYEVCKRIKSKDELKGIKILILTAKGLQSDMRAAKEAKADRYLAKPFSPKELILIVEELLGG